MESVGKRKLPKKEEEIPEIRKKARYYSQEYRDRIKKDPKLYCVHRKFETARIAEFREKRQSDEAKQQNRDLQRLRQRK